MSSDIPAWVRDAVFYQVFPDRLARSGRVPAPGPLEPWDAPPTSHGFKGGDLYGVAQHLDRLRTLGITALYLTPVFASASNHRYHTDDYFHVDPLLGGDEALRNLLDEAHARDMRVVLDGVFNHCGRGFWPFHHVLENGARSPYRGWFHLDPDVLEGRRQLSAFPTMEELSRIGVLRSSGSPSGSASRAVLGYEAWWDLPALPRLDLDEPHLRALILDVAEHWLRLGIDGWRLDVAEEIGIDFWREFRARCRSVRADAYLVAEIWRIGPQWIEGDSFDALMDYPLAQAIVGFAAQHRLATAIDLPWEYRGTLASLDAAAFWDRVEALRSAYGAEVMSSQLNLLGSHDTPRLRTLCGGDLDAVRLAMLLQMTLPGTPCVFYGDEIGLEGLMDPDCRRSFPAEPDAWEDEPSGWLADLVALRHSSRALRDGELTLLHADGPSLAFLRHRDGDVFVCLANAGEVPLSGTLDLPVSCSSVASVPLRGPDAPSAHLLADRSLVIEAPPRQGGVLRLTLA